MLLEAGQATLLDVDHGTYPFVTSSSATAGGACTGSGIAAHRDRPGHRHRQGLHHARRRGAVPHRAVRRRGGEWLRKTGGEFGTTTGRPRRCGWYDAPIARYAARINGVTDFVLTKLDVLTGWDRIPVCVAYDVDGVRYDEMPVTQTDFHHAKPIYEFLAAGARTSPAPARSTTCRQRAQAYVAALEEMSGARISAIGVGPGREQTVVVHDLL